MDSIDRIIGCILGGAIGDAMGGPYEGLKGPIKLDSQREWRLSDDTQMTLATCEAISSCGSVDPSVIAATYASWYKDSRFTGLGASTYKALSELVRGGHWALVGRKGEMAAGNGAAMRIAPLAFCLDPKERKARLTIREISRITHHNEEAYSGALAVVAATRAAWDGDWTGKNDLIAFVVNIIPDSSVRDRLIDLAQIGEAISLQEIAERYGCSGYVVESIPLALCAAQRIESLGFQPLLEELISVGGDTDTIASITGQITGALIGHSSLPAEMIARLPDLETITTIARRFAETVSRRNDSA